MDISYKPAGQFELTRFEKIHNISFESSYEASIVVAREIADLIKHKQQQNLNCVLGLATGSSPTKVYEELVRLQKVMFRVMIISCVSTFLIT
jgi:glucosamine-6-phosphate deaminase